MKRDSSYKFRLKYFHPICFSYVMATEIVSIGLYIQHYNFFSMLLHVLGTIGYILLIIFQGARIWKYPKEAWRDLIYLPRGFEYFSLIAGTNTLLVRMLFDTSSISITVMAILSLIISMFLFYFVGLNLLLHNQKPISESVSPGWLLSVIAIQSLSVLFSSIVGNNMLTDELFWLIAYASWTIGIILYFIMIIFVLQRSFFSYISANDLQLGYWMCMGAAAISVLAGSQLTLYSHTPDFILKQQVLIEAIVTSLWIWCTLWIPFLVLMEIYKCIILKQPIQYQIYLWSTVFPLGMYSVASDVCFRITHLNIMNQINEYWIWIAFVTWIFVMLLYFRSRPSTS